MRRLLSALLLLPFCAAPALAQTLDVIGTVQVPTIEREARGETEVVGGSDVWPYVANDGREYAIMGDVEGITIVAVPSMEVVGRVDGPTENAPFYWRDIKTYGSFAYVVSECFGRSEGLQIIDLRGLPERVAEIAVIRGTDDRLVSSHNLTIDTHTATLWMLNSNGTELVGLDLTNPIAPVEIGQVPVTDSHDGFARRDTLYIAEGRQPTFSMWDVSDAAAPRLLGRATVPQAGYVHNIWPTDDGRHVLTTEETAGKSIKVWNVEDPNNITLVGEWLGASGLAHNVHVQGDYAFISHYSSGVHVVDISDVANPREVAHHDTYAPHNDSSFKGTWGATLPTPAGHVFGSDLEGKLTVMRWTPPVNG
jgi:choice-of-anchor B domain-containing protein